MNPIHKNAEGSFQELAHKSDVDFGQLSILEINSGCIRGGHYHKRKVEWFCAISGSCILEIVDVKTDEKKVCFLDSKVKEFVKVIPYEYHFLFNPASNLICEVLIITNEEYDENDPDTFNYRGE